MLTRAPEPLNAIAHGMFLRRAGSSMHDRDYMIEWFNRHNEDVQRAIKPERLLVYEVNQGWEPLCRFLGVSVPDQWFPRTNERKDLETIVRQKLDDIG